MTTASLLAQSFGEEMLRHYTDRLASVEGVAVIVAALLVAAAVFAVDWAKWAVLSAAISVSVFSIKRPDLQPDLPSPFRQIGEWSQALSFGLVGLLAIAALRPTGWRRTSLLHPALFALFALQATISLRQVFGGLPEKGLGSLVVYVVMFGVLGLGIARWLYDDGHVRDLARTVSWAAGLVIVGSLAVMAISYSSAFAGPRFMGVTSNPQRLGAMLGMAFPFSLALIVDRRSPPYTRTIHAAIAAFAVLMILASGSRTGFLLLLIGTAVFFRTRLGPALLAIVGVGTFALIGYLLLLGEAVDESGGLVIRTNNSRSEVWERLWDQFQASPLIGTALDYVPGESSYLSTLVMAGVVGLVPMLVLVWLLGWTGFKLVRRRRALGSYAVFGDLAVASVAQMLAAWMFEAFALGTITDHTLVVYCTFALLGLLRERLSVPHPPTDAGFLVVVPDGAGNVEEYDPTATHPSSAAAV